MINLEKEFDSEELEIYKKMPEAAFSDLKNRIERINNMNEQEVIEKLKKFHLNARGSDNALRTRLKNSYKKIILAGKDLVVSQGIPPYFVVIDFEATCEEFNSLNFRQEIIEFPAVLVDTKNQKIVDCFQMYCKPQINPILSKFCTDLTGITQEQVDSAETFDKVLEHFNRWLKQHKLGKKNKYAIVTDSPWDMCRYLYSQCYSSRIKYPTWGFQWVNLRKIFSRFYECGKVCLKSMLEILNMEFSGRLHCGLDDARNIARILLKMIYDGANIVVNEGLSQSVKNKIRHKLISIGENKDMENEFLPKKVEARVVAIRSSEKMTVYKRTKRERQIRECQIGKKILQNSDTTGKKDSVQKNQKGMTNQRMSNGNILQNSDKTEKEDSVQKNQKGMTNQRMSNGNILQNSDTTRNEDSGQKNQKEPTNQTMSNGNILQNAVTIEKKVNSAKKV